MQRLRARPKKGECGEKSHHHGAPLGTDRRQAAAGSLNTGLRKRPNDLHEGDRLFAIQRAVAIGGLESLLGR
jgi:hypothetical protein